MHHNIWSSLIHMENKNLPYFVCILHCYQLGTYNFVMLHNVSFSIACCCSIKLNHTGYNFSQVCNIFSTFTAVATCMSTVFQKHRNPSISSSLFLGFTSSLKYRIAGIFQGGKIFVDIENFAGSWKEFLGRV